MMYHVFYCIAMNYCHHPSGLEKYVVIKYVVRSNIVWDGFAECDFIRVDDKKRENRFKSVSDFTAHSVKSMALLIERRYKLI